MTRHRMPAEIRGLLLFDLALVALYLLDRAAGPASDFLTHFLDLDGEANLPSWASTLQLAGAGIFLMMAWRRQPSPSPVRRGLLALGLLLIFLSLDEAASIHEWLGHFIDRVLPSGTRAGSILSRTGIWMFALVPLAAGWTWWFARPCWDAIGEVSAVRLPGLAGPLLFLGSAGGVEVLSNFVPPRSTPDLLLIALEEGGELVGATLLVWAGLGLWQGLVPHEPAPTRLPDK